ncbi:hypothetical protein KL929_003011 [Ogataea haglerorum]|uniref:uncharacterized protein n=1 Tax=Ogataea haglerorum TaxID=1937702 RepID=UPI001C8AB259|nr:uncharacterized protein KL911_003018 [Ogataea haglerorum]KAG7695757.1 hypothetical protein KL951_003282 [Ogataea haglerorum]KAG7718543.1 hypothetical protein KL913_002538 [Ogataea haglerorum]KAG7718608.1 hypothetical protein KL949_002604 [Ogataea haglerorum]KAG7752913.1 hypothetical protein KL911_003018 [Ogataea haglerorum]KAG7767083.1 hypothetical protein KL931_003967 [Ogataea haglerorum]
MSSRLKYRRRRNDKDDTKPLCEQPQRDSPEYLHRLIAQLYGVQQESLPAFTSSSSVDNELHALVGLLLREFVLGWYNNVAFDENGEFLNETVALIAHLTRDLQQRCLRIDWTRLLLDDLFVILSKHTEALREARKRVGTKFSSQDENELTANYLSLNGHFAIQLDNPERERQYMQVLVKKLTVLMLPNEEAESALSRLFAETFFGDLILRNVVENLTDNFMLWNMIKAISEASSGRPKTARPFFEQVSAGSRQVGHIVAYCTSVFSSKPAPQSLVTQYAVFPFINNMVHFSDRHPLVHLVVTTTAALLQKSKKFNHLCNNVLNNLVYNRILTSGTIASAVRTLRHIMFPTDANFNTTPRYVPQTTEELDEIKLNAKIAMEKVLSRPYIDTESFLCSFEHKAINKSLMWNILDLLLTNIYPELKDM